MARRTWVGAVWDIVALLNGDEYGRRDYHHVYEGPHLKATIKEQFKAHWPAPGSPGFALPVFDLYRDLKETKPL